MTTKDFLFYFGSVLFMCCFMVSCLAMSMTAAEDLTTDQSALLALKAHITSDPHRVLKYNWSFSYPVCNWVGIACDVRHRRVTGLNLSFMNLEGIIPSNLGNLSFLNYLQLRDNNFHGHLPNELVQLRRLRVLNFNNNKISGAIPIWIGVLSKLRFIHLSNNSLTGTIPDSLFNLSKLEILEFSYNIVEGNISPEIGKLSNLKLIDLGNNHLSGSIPSAIFNISTLQMIDFNSNSLSGTLPDDLCSHLPKLELLGLGNNKLLGHLSTSLGNCSEIRNLSLSFNKFTGRIPETIGNLKKLSYLFLSDNSLEGLIPSTIFNISSSKSIVLANNSLFGSIPVDMCDGIPAIEELRLRRNNISGSIPKNLNNCTSLNFLDLQDNRLTGEIPKEIGMLQNLEYLYLGENSLTGLIPPIIFNISTIVHISLVSNDLSGHLPSGMGNRLPKLESLVLARNKISGTIPSSISNASKLYYLSLSTNSFSGHIPNTFGNLRHLGKLFLLRNNLTAESSTAEWSFISSLANCRELTRLSVSYNPLYGILPHSIGNISESLQYFFANDCKLRGSIPVEFGNLHNLIVLSLANNSLTGTIPITVGRLLQLQDLDLFNNNLQGFIPEDICHLEGLTKLSLDENMLYGPIPVCLANLTSLRKLYLGFNKLTSGIPSSLWTLKYVLEINLSSNSLTGPLSSDVQNLKVLINLDLSMNQLSGDIPITIDGLKDLVTLSLASNRFQGHIPESFGGLTSLESLDLSNNDLDAEIPKSLEALSYLKYFNVSRNRLQGEIPTKGPFRNFSAQSFLSNYALCGSPRLQVPPCKDDTIKRSKTITLVFKYVLPPIISAILVVTVVIIFIRCRSRRAKNLPQEDLLPLTACKRTSYSEIQRATEGFSEYNLLGKGSFGSVYKGTLSNGTNVAVKVFNLQVERAFRSFDSECEILRNIRHRNIVKILSSCCNVDFKALILEFMPNGSLEKWLYSHNYFLDILERLNIMADVASALEYLHYGQSAAPVVHCDLKPSNILLDENMVAHVSDFGISKLFGEGDFMTETLTMATIGYMAPEYGSEGIVSPRSDVYSYGILLMETFTRKKPTDEMFSGEMSLKNWVTNSLPHGLTEVVDTNLLREETAFGVKMDCILSIMDLALHCTMDSPEQRISMIDVAAKLEKIKMKFVNAGGATT